MHPLNLSPTAFCCSCAPPPLSPTKPAKQTITAQAFTRGMYELMKSGLGVTTELPGAPKKSEAAAAADKEDSEEESDKSEL